MGQFFGALNDFLRNPGGGFLVNLLSGARFNRRFDEFLREQVTPFQEAGKGIAENLSGTIPAQAQQFASQGINLGNRLFNPDAAITRFNTAFNPIFQGFRALPGRAEAGNAAVQQAFGDVGRNLAAGTAGIQSGFGNLVGGFDEQLARARGLVSTLGGQERRDINTRFDALSSQNQANLAARGLGGSTVTTSQEALVNRERGDELRRLQDQLTRERLGVEATFGGAALGARERALGAQERLLGAGVNLGVAGAGALQRGNEFATNTALQSLASQGNIAAGRLASFDQAAQNQLNNLFGFGGFGINTALAGNQAALGLYSPFPLVAPQQTNPASILPSVR